MTNFTGFSIRGNANSIDAGEYVASAADVNGDGFQDILLADPSLNFDTDDRRDGAVYVLFGRGDINGTIDLTTMGDGGFVIRGSVGAYDGLDEISNTIGDINGDGYGDLFIGGGESPAVIFGGTDLGGIDFELTRENAETYGSPFLSDSEAEFENRVTNASAGGDIDGDGQLDVIFGQRFFGTDGSDRAGQITVFTGDSIPDVIDPRQIEGFSVSGPSEQFSFAYVIEGLGDVDGDGYDDVLIASDSQNTGAGTNAGAVYILYGAPNDPAPDINLNSGRVERIDGTLAYGRFGLVASAIGDINGDGLADLAAARLDVDEVVTYDQYDPPISFGRGDSATIYVVFGTDARSDIPPNVAEAPLTITGITSPTSFMRFDIDGAGDINGDGIDDLIIGVETEGTTDARSIGAAYLVFGTDQGFPATLDLATLDGTQGYKIVGEFQFDSVGQTVAGLGDVNGDGLDDLGIGSNILGGETRVLFGSASNLALLDRSDSPVGAADGVIEFRRIGDDLDLEAGVKAGDDVFTTQQNFGRVFHWSGFPFTLLSNDTGPFSEALTVTSVDESTLQFGSIQSGFDIVSGNDPDFLAFIYRPDTSNLELLALDEGDVLTDVFTYTVTDGFTSDTAQVTVTITGVDDAPIATDDRVLIDAAEPTEIDLFTNDFDPEGKGLELTALGTPLFGSLIDLGDGRVRYTPSDTFQGDDRFTYTVTDPSGQTATATVSILETGFFSGLTLLAEDFSFIRNFGDRLDLIDFNADGIGDVFAPGRFQANLFVGTDAALPRALPYEVVPEFGLQVTASPDNHWISLGDINGDGYDDLAAVNLGFYSVSDVAAENFLSGDGGFQILLGGSETGDVSIEDFGADRTVRVLSAGDIAERFIDPGPAPLIEGDGSDGNGDGYGYYYYYYYGYYGDGPDGETSEPPEPQYVDPWPITASIGVRTTVTALGDINGDGFDDILVDADARQIGFYDPGLERYGYVNQYVSRYEFGDQPEDQKYILFGGAGLPVSEGEDLSQSTRVQDFLTGGFVSRLAAIGDVTGDGRDDMWFFGGSEIVNGSFDRFFYLLPGTNGALPATFSTDAIEAAGGIKIFTDDFSIGAFGVGDINDDGIEDLVLNNFSTGNTDLIFGRSAAEWSSVDARALTPEDGIALSLDDLPDGYSTLSAASTAGDLNNDGLVDIALGFSSTTQPGLVAVIFGQSGGFADAIQLADLDGTDGFLLIGNDVGSFFGHRLAGGEDVNGDGIDDLVIGALREDTPTQPGGNSGAVHILFGSDTLIADLDPLDGTSDGRISIGSISTDGTPPEPDAIVVSIGGGGSVVEGDTGAKSVNFTVTRLDDGGNAIDVLVRISSGSGADTDDVLGGLPRTETVTLAAGQTSATVPVTILGDFNVESNESLTATIQSVITQDDGPVSIVNNATTLVIENDDERPRLSIEGPGDVDEGDVGTVDAGFVVTRTGGLEDRVSFNVQISGVDDADINGGAQIIPVTIEAGETEAVVRIDIIGDRDVEPDEVILARITDAQSNLDRQVDIGTRDATVTILNDDEITTINVEALQGAVTEGGGLSVRTGANGTPVTRGFGPASQNDPRSAEIEFVIHRDGDLDGTTVVDYSVIEGAVTPNTYWQAFYRREDWNEEFILNTATLVEATSASTLQPQTSALNGGFSTDLTLSGLFDLGGLGSVDLLELQGLESNPLNFNRIFPLIDIDETYQNVGAGGLTWDFGVEIATDFELSLAGLTPGAFDIVSRLGASAVLPAFAVEGEAVNVVTSDQFSLSHSITGETLNFANFELKENIFVDIDIENIQAELFGFDLFALDGLPLPTIDTDITLLNIKPSDITIPSNFDGFEIVIAPPGGASQTDQTGVSFNQLATASVDVVNPLISLDLSIIEFISNFAKAPNPALLTPAGFLALSKLASFDTGEQTFNIPGVGQITAQAALTLLEFVISAGLSLKQTYSFTPNVDVAVELNGQTVEGGTLGDGFRFDGDWIAGDDIFGQVELSYGGTLGVSYELAPFASFSYEVLKGQAQIIDPSGQVDFKAGFGPLFGDTFTATLDAFAVAIFPDLEVEIATTQFATEFIPFSLPVRASDVPDDAFFAGSVTFAPGETEKTVSLFVPNDQSPEGDQEVILRVDSAVDVTGGDVVVETDRAVTTVQDDDDIVSLATVPRFTRFRDADGFGDPHLITLDGLSYDFHVVGEFTLIEAVSGADLLVQARTVAVPGSDLASQISAVAVDLAGVRVTIDASRDEPVWVDGAPVQISPETGIFEVGAGAIYFDGGKYVIESAGGDAIAVGVFDGFLNVCIFLDASRDSGSVHGLLGNGDGDASNDIALRDGSVLGLQPDYDTLYGTFADAWRLSDEDSLLDYGEGEGTSDYTDLSFPAAAIVVDDLPASLREMAEAQLDAAGITDPDIREATIYDLIVTGNLQFIEAASTVVARSVVELELNNAPASAPDAVGISPLTPQIVEGDSGQRELMFELFRTGSNDTALEVALISSGALAGVANLPASVTLVEGQSSVTLSVLVNADDLPGTDRDLTLEIALPDALDVLILTSRATATILEDDNPDPILISLASDRSEVIEGGAVTFTVSLSQETDIPITFDATVLMQPLAGSVSEQDIAGGLGALGRFTIPAGESTLSIVVTTQEDTVFEETEAFALRLFNVEGATSDTALFAVSVLDDDTNRAPIAEQQNDLNLKESDDPQTLDLAIGVSDPDGDTVSLISASLVFGDTQLALSADQTSVTLDPRLIAELGAIGDSVTFQIDAVFGDAQGAQVVQTLHGSVLAEAGPFTFYLDSDDDGFGNPDQMLTDFNLPDGYARVAGDATDLDDTIYPGAPEINDDKDNDQDGEVDEDNTAPTLLASSVGGTEDTPISLSLALNAFDADGDDLTFALVADGINGSAQISGDGELVYMPDADFYGPDSVTYEVRDGKGGTASTVLDILIDSTNDAPVLNAVGPFSVAENSTEIGTITVTDVDSTDLTFSISDGADKDFFEIDAATGLLSFVSAPDFEAPASAAGTNVYEVEVSVTDDEASDDEFYYVTVADVDEVGPPNLVFGTNGSDRNVVGSEGDDIINSLAGRSDGLTGLGGADVFDFSESTSNETREIRRISDFDAQEGDTIDLGLATVANVREIRGNTYLYLDEDRDLIILSGVSNFDTDSLL